MNRASGLCLLLMFAICFRGQSAGAQTLLGPAVPANAEHADEQNAPSVAIAQDGTGVLVYGGDVYSTKVARWLDSAGIPYGPEIRLYLDGRRGALRFQDATVNRKGQGAVCWENSDVGFGLCRLADTQGTLEPREIRGSEDTEPYLGREYRPRVDVFQDGAFVLGWMNYLRDEQTSPDEDVLDPTLRFFSAEGMPVGPEILLDDNVGGELRNIDVAALSSGRAVAVWSGGGIDSDGLGIRARLVDRSGDLIGQPIGVNTFEPGYQKYPHVASNLDDRFVVVWESDGQDGSGSGVYGQLFDGAGNKLGSEFQITSQAPSWQGLPAVAMDRSGRFAVTFYSSGETFDTGSDIFVRAYRADGTPFGPQIQLTEPEGVQDYPSVAISDSGLIHVAFEGPWEPPGELVNYDILHTRLVLPCEADAYTLCLAGGRFAVRAFWRNRAGAEDLAEKIPLTTDTGGFYFFDSTNFELLVKVLDACAINQRFWVFAAGLTDVEVDVLVTDTFTGQVMTYHNEQGRPFAPVQDIDSFDGCNASAPLGWTAPALEVAAASPLQTVTGPCVSAPGILCLGGGRFRVTANWTDFVGQNGPAVAFPQSANSGLFYFFGQNNLELAIKVLDGCAVNNRHWVYVAGLTDVGVSILVEDLIGGGSWTRSSPLGSPFEPILDSAAFATCP